MLCSDLITPILSDAGTPHRGQCPGAMVKERWGQLTERYATVVEGPCGQRSQPPERPALATTPAVRNVEVRDEEDWKLLRAITDKYSPSYTEPLAQSGPGHVHVDWRGRSTTAYTYIQDGEFV